MWIYDEDQHVLFDANTFKLEVIMNYDRKSFNYIIVAYGENYHVGISKYETKEEAIEALIEIKNNIKNI